MDKINGIYELLEGNTSHLAANQIQREIAWDTTISALIYKTDAGVLYTLRSAHDHLQLENIGTNSHSQIDSFIASRGQINGLASLDGTGKIPSGQLPSFVDDVEEYADAAAFPVTGESGKLYLAIDTGSIYRWSGSVYVKISTYISEPAGQLVLGSGSGITSSALIKAIDYWEAGSKDKLVFETSSYFEGAILKVEVASDEIGLHDGLNVSYPEFLKLRSGNLNFAGRPNNSESYFYIGQNNDAGAMAGGWCIDVGAYANEEDRIFFGSSPYWGYTWSGITLASKHGINIVLDTDRNRVGDENFNVYLKTGLTTVSKIFSVNHATTNINIPTGWTYDINNTPHTHDMSTINISEPAGQILVGTGTGIDSYSTLKWDNDNQVLSATVLNGNQAIIAGTILDIETIPRIASGVWLSPGGSINVVDAGGEHCFINCNSIQLFETSNSVTPYAEFGRYGANIPINQTYDIAGQPHTHLFATLSDFNISNPLNGDIIAYDTATGKWKNVVNTGSTIAEPSGQIVYGTGTGVDSHGDLKFTGSDFTTTNSILQVSRGWDTGLAAVISAYTGQTNAYLWAAGNVAKVVLGVHSLTGSVNTSDAIEITSTINIPTGKTYNINGSAHTYHPYLTLDIVSAAPAYAEGLVFYDNHNKSLAYYTDIQGVTCNIGKELYYGDRVRNLTGSTILNGKVVYHVGVSGGTPTIALADNSNPTTARVVGVVTTDIADNAYGYVTTYGVVRDLNTSMFNNGDTVYLGTNGALVATPPTSGAVIKIGRISNAHNTQGELIVDIESDPTTTATFQNLKILGSLTSLTNIDIAYNSQYTKNGYQWTNEYNGNQTGYYSYDEATRTFTYNSGGTSVYWINGVRYTAPSNTTTVQHGTGVQVHYIYIDENNLLQQGTTPWNLNANVIPLLAVYYTANVKSIPLYELHNHTRNRDWHANAHTSVGTKAQVDGFALQNINQDTATTDADLRYGIASGWLKDEDIKLTLDALSSGGTSYNILYRATAANPDLTVINNALPFQHGSNYISYNDIVNGGFVESTNGKWVNYFVIALPVKSSNNGNVITTTSHQYRFLFVPGQSQHDSLDSARAEEFWSLDMGDLANFTEWTPIYRITYKVANGETTTHNVEVDEWKRYYESRAGITGMGSSAVTHNALVGRDAVAAHPIGSITGTANYLAAFDANGNGTSIAQSTFALSGHNHSGTYQPASLDLTAIDDLSGTSGMLKKTAANTWALVNPITLTKTLVVEAPTSSEKIPIFRNETGANITIREIVALVGGSSQSVTYSVKIGSTFGTATTTVASGVVVTNYTTGDATTYSSNNVVTNDYWVWFETTASTATYITLVVRYTED